MTTRTDDSASPLIESRDDLLSVFAGGEKPRERWRIGTEHEKFVYRLDDHRAPSWDEPGGIRDLLLGLTEFGWKPVEEGGKIIALTGADGTISLEPAGQFELSGAPLENLHQSCAESGRHLHQCKAVGDRLGLGFLGTGMWPDKTRAELPVMPKGRYAIMLGYMPKVGSLGLDMMLRTCTIQVNLDYSSEADMVKKFRVGLALQPVATALFANSPFTEGKPNGYKSFRSHIWEDTDPDRTGMLPFVFEDGFGYERYCDYALNVPMYFVYRDGKYIDVAGESFGDFLEGKLPQLPGEKPMLTDWVDHLSTAFPEVRLKSFLEMRGADGGRWGRICALPALWVGLLYDQQALDAAWELVKPLEHRGAREAAPRRAETGAARRSRPTARRCRTFAGRVLDIAAGGLTRRARLNSAGDNEGGFLDPLRDVVATGMTPADRLLAKYAQRVGRRRLPHLRGVQLLMDMLTAPSAARSIRRSSPTRPACSTSATATASIGSYAAIRMASRLCSCTAAPAADRAPDHRRQFNPDKYKILVFDQRGCGKSTPYASLENNTTWDLVEDIEKLRTASREGRQVAGVRRQLGLDPRARLRARPTPSASPSWCCAASSCSTSSKSTGCTRRAARRRSIRTSSTSSSRRFPKGERGDLVEAYRKRLTSDDKDEQLAAAKAWSKWEGEIVTLLPSPDDDRAFHRARSGRRRRADREPLHGEPRLARGRPAAATARRSSRVFRASSSRAGTTPARRRSPRGSSSRRGPRSSSTSSPTRGHLFSEPGNLDAWSARPTGSPGV